jgi:seryl-tRNA synthetase
MLDIKLVRQNPTAVAERLAIKGFEFDSAAFTELDARRKQADMHAQSLQAERKAASKKIGELVAQGTPVEDAKAEVNKTLERIAAEIDAATAEAKAVQQALEALLMAIPNLPDESVPAGSSEDDNVEVTRWSAPKTFDFDVKDHVDIAESLSLLDTEAAGKITGSRFAVMYGGLAQLHRALIQFMLNEHTALHGYTEVYVPYIVNRASLEGTGQLPKFAEDLFRLEGDHDYFLIPTAEVPVTNLIRDRILEDEEMGDQGLRFVAHTPCFRSEAGSYGRDTRGLIRQHQFEKVELVQVVRPEQSEHALEALTGHAEAILQKLDLPYRKVMLCGGDLGLLSGAHLRLGGVATRPTGVPGNFQLFQLPGLPGSPHAGEMAQPRNRET